MANYEGRGHLAPAKLSVLLAPEEMLALYRIALHLNRYENRSDKWGRGICDSLTIDGVGELNPRQRAIFAGKIGEHAVRELARRRPFGSLVPAIDIGTRVNGDGGVDLDILGMRLQIKTRQRAGGSNLIKRIDEGGNVLSLFGEAHVFCEWVPPAPRVFIVGWLWNRDIVGMPIVPSPVGKWKNIEVPGAALLPLFRLWAELESRRELGAA